MKEVKIKTVAHMENHSISIMKYITKYKYNYCDFCGKFFTELGKLKKHIKKIHPL